MNLISHDLAVMQSEQIILNSYSKPFTATFFFLRGSYSTSFLGTIQ